MSIDAMKTALEALQFHNLGREHVPQKSAEAIAALHAAIEQAEKQEPKERYTYGTPLLDRFTKPQEKQEPVAWMEELPAKENEKHVRFTAHKFVADEWENSTPLYTAPPQQEKQEPVAWANINQHGDITHTSNKPNGWAKTPLYTAPPQRQPLTEEELDQIYQAHHNKYGHPEGPAWAYERAVERAHGIGGGE